MQKNSIPYESRVCSVIVPCVKSQLPSLLTALRVWSKPGFRPYQGTPPRDVALLIVLNSATGDEIETLRSEIYEIPVSSAFSEIHVLDAALKGDRDLYVRESDVGWGRYGNRAGPNFLFQKSMHFAHPFGGYVLQIEADCLPTEEGWLDNLNMVLSAHSTAWVIGSPYLQNTPMERRVQFHMNGNALYRAGDPAFLKFLDSVWIPRLNAISRTYPNVAYDCWWAFEMSRANSATQNEAWQIWQRYCFRFSNSPIVLNLTVSPSSATEFLRMRESLREEGLHPLFFHGSVMSAVIDHVVASDYTLPEAIRKVEADGVPDHLLSDDRAPLLPRGPIGSILHNLGIRRPRSKVALGSGFHQLEDLTIDGVGAIGAWTDGPLFELTPVEIHSGIYLSVARNPMMPPLTTENFEISAIQNGHRVDLDFHVHDGIYATVALRGQDIEVDKVLRFEFDVPIVKPGENDSRTRGLLVIFSGVDV